MTPISLRGPTPRWCAVIAFFGLVLTYGAGAGVVDIVKNGRRDLGTGVVSDRLMETRCHRKSCREHKAVHLQIDRAGVVGTLLSDDLYDLLGDGDHRIAVEVEQNTFSHHISRIRAGGEWYRVDGPGRAGLVYLIPGVLLGLLLIVVNAGALARGVARRLVARRRGWRWALVVIGTAGAMVFALVSAVGVSDDRYYAGDGVLFGRHATYGNNTYRELVLVRMKRARTARTVESSELYALAAASRRGRLAVQVDEDAGDEITAVRYHGTSYDVGTPSSVVLIVTLPLGLIALAIVVLNGRALRRGRSASPAGTPPAGRAH